MPTCRIGEDPSDLVPTVRRPGPSPGTPPVFVDHGDLAVTACEAPEGSSDDPPKMPVEYVEVVLGAAVTGVAATIRAQRHEHRWVSDTEDHAGVVKVGEPAASDDDRERSGRQRHEAVGSSDVGAATLRPFDRHIALDHGETVLGERREPSVGSGAEDPPLGGIEQPRVLLLWR